MATALRHAAPLLSIRAPIIAGLGAAGLFALLAAGIAIFGDGQIETPSARGDVTLAAAPIAETYGSEETSNPIEFYEPVDEGEASLTGVPEGFRDQARAQPDETGSQPDETGQTANLAATSNSPRANPNALPHVSSRGLTEPGPGGPLPIIAQDGRRVSREYARPFHGDPNTPMIGLVVGGMGMSPRVTEAAINELPPEVALSFAPYAANLQDWVDRARAAGHEVLIEAPMEPFDYPNNDPGPHTLLADGPSAENERRLAWVLSRTSGYFGVSNYLGARFSTSSPAMTQLLQSLERRGVAFLHDGGGRRSMIENVGRETDVTFAISDRILDENPNPDAIDERLFALEALAIQNGSALGSGFAYPATVDQIIAWAEGLELRGYQLAPPSAIMARRRLENRLEAEAAAAENHDTHASTDHRWASDPSEGSDDDYGGGDDYGH
ncbi:MAG: divergent polysaccharide deacetylase family protein [Alphaproteobacteria bacterium]|nr:divergent polysaccharide deacetylase family protein [Alphaproteobacteria bacterium]